MRRIVVYADIHGILVEVARTRTHEVVRYSGGGRSWERCQNGCCLLGDHSDRNPVWLRCATRGAAECGSTRAGQWVSGRRIVDQPTPGSERNQRVLIPGQIAKS